MNRRWLRWWPAAVAVVVLAGGSSVAVAAVSGAFSSRTAAPNGQCSAPALPGTVVDVELTDMGGMMRGGHGDGSGGMMWGGYGGNAYGPGGPMRILLSGDAAPAGSVSFRVVNTGRLVHEMVVLPLARGASAGERTVGANDRVSERGALGEASNTCGSGAGDGVDPGAISWVTLHLPAGDYELVCNIPGHYAAGMYAELHVS